MRAPVHHSGDGHLDGGQAQWRHRAVHPGQDRPWCAARLPGTAGQRGQAGDPGSAGGRDDQGTGPGRSPLAWGGPGHLGPAQGPRRGCLPEVRLGVPGFRVARRLRGWNHRLAPGAPKCHPRPGADGIRIF